MKTLSRVGWVVVSVVAVALGACTIRTLPADGTPQTPTAQATATATPAATTTATATATATSTGKVVPKLSQFTRVGPGVASAQPATGKMTGSNMFGAQSGTPTALKGDVYWLPQSTTKLPDFDKLTPATTLWAEVLNAPKREFTEGFPGVDAKRLEYFGIRYTGQFVVAAAGDYTFKVFSKDGTKVYVDNALVLDNDGVLGSPVDKSGPVKLTAGQHSLRVDYFMAGKGQAALQLFVTGADKQEKPWLPAF
jgi:hypothetical protein